MCAPVELSTVVFRYKPPGLAPPEVDAANAKLLRLVNESGDVFLSGTKVNGTQVLRLAIGNLRTTERHVLRAMELLEQTAKGL